MTAITRYATIRLGFNDALILKCCPVMSSVIIEGAELQNSYVGRNVSRGTHKHANTHTNVKCNYVTGSFTLISLFTMQPHVLMQHPQPLGPRDVLEGGGGGVEGGGGVGWDTPPPRVPLWSPPKAGRKL